MPEDIDIAAFSYRVVRGHGELCFSLSLVGAYAVVFRTDSERNASFLLTHGELNLSAFEHEVLRDIEAEGFCVLGRYELWREAPVAIPFVVPGPTTTLFHALFDNAGAPPPRDPPIC